jgi:ketosteroid isomerase-like protein
VHPELSDSEIAERGYRAWNEDDLEGLLAVTHAEAEYHPSGVFLGMEDVYRGEEGIRRWWQTFREPWSRIKVIPERIADHPDGLAVLVRFEGLGRHGVETTMHFINLLEFRDGLIYRLGARPATEESIRDLGLGRDPA